MFDYLPANIHMQNLLLFSVINVDSIVESQKVLESVNLFWRYSFTNYYKWLQTEGVMLPFIKRVQECSQWEGPICIMCSSCIICSCCMGLSWDELTFHFHVTILSAYSSPYCGTWIYQRCLILLFFDEKIRVRLSAPYTGIMH